MKRYIIIFLLAAFAWNMQAQNVPVIPLDERVGGYYYWDSNWVDMYYDTCQIELVPISNLMGGPLNCPTIGLRFFYSKAPLKIIGIAGSLTSEEIGHWFRGVWDRSYIPGDIDHPEERLPEYFQLYTYENGRFGLAAQALWDTASVKYYMRIEDRLFMNEDSVVVTYATNLPMYECYFEKAVVVKDSFYVGYTFNNNYKNASDHHQDHYCTYAYFLRVNHMDYAYDYDPYLSFEWLPLIKWRNASIDPDLYVSPGSFYPDTNWHWRFHINAQTVVFPIFDTSDVTEVPQTVLEEYVMMRPNPATDRVQVFSSFNIRSIEVHNIAGQLVERRKVDATQTVLDVSAWEKGPYVVTITTPAGTVTRKLVVQ